MSYWDKEDSLPTRASLLSRIKDLDDQESWRDFFNTYWKLIYAAARRTGLQDAESQEVVQEVLLTVTKKIQEFKYDPAQGSFKGWLRRTTKFRIGDQLRKRKRAPVPLERAPNDSRDTEPIDRVADSARCEIEAVWDEEWAKNLVDAALEKVREQVNPKHFQIYDAYVVKGWSVSEVMGTLGVSRTEVYLAKLRVGRVVRKEVLRLEKDLV